MFHICYFFPLKVRAKFMLLSIVSDKKIFKLLPIGVYVNKFDLSARKVKVNPWLYFFKTLLGPCLPCRIPSPRAIGTLILEKKF